MLRKARIARWLGTRRMAVLRWVSVLVLVGTVRTRADVADPDEGSAYRAAVELGISEYEQHNFAEARAQFARAHELAPCARTLRGLGMVEFELRNYPDSVRFLSQALASTVKPLGPELQTSTEDLLRRARAYVAQLELAIQPSTASVTVDGIAQQPGSTLMLGVGDHVLEFQQRGYISERRQLKVTGGEAQSLRVELQRVEPLHPSPIAHEPRLLRKNPWLWTGIGLVVAGGAAGLAIALRGSGSAVHHEEPYAGTSGAAPLVAP